MQAFLDSTTRAMGFAFQAAGKGFKAAALAGYKKALDASFVMKDLY
ncbi:MAG: hypothetical protein IPJ18_22765 [Betaproteobacteria bacterium]|nr:hypothetical protein [Betaproteobacteria bacterium]